MRKSRFSEGQIIGVLREQESGAQAFLNPEVLSRDLDRALDHPNQVRGARPAADHATACRDKRPFDATPAGR
jgi:hypothetical protein